MSLSQHIFELPESSDEEPPGDPDNSRRIHVNEVVDNASSSGADANAAQEYMSHHHNEACINDLQREIKQLTCKLTMLADDGGTHSTQSKYEDKRETPAARQIKQLGGKFVTMYMLWLGSPNAAFRVMPDPAYQPKDRFMPGLDAKRQGEHADLLAVFPEEYHHLFKEKSLQQTFVNGMNTEQSNISPHIRSRLGPWIFNFTPEQFASPEWRYEHCHKLVGWTQSDDGTAHYAPFCPILYHEYAGHQDINTIFLHQSLLDIFLVIIRDPGALDRTCNIKKGGRATMDAIWGLTEITPSAITTSAILAHFALSKDTALQRQGATTKINYEADFHTYLLYLTVAREEQKRSILTIFQKWDAYFFPQVAKDTATIKAPAESINSAFTALEGLSETEPQPTLPAQPSWNSSTTRLKTQASGSDILPSLADHQGLDALESRGRGIGKGLRKGSMKI
ncbi:hypothetical protein JB92DRAFT_3108918 [Gautieria morchelliformis]|nr:hypothetical protein JB92DRAFT_3108918 [Gautieria morchelliformis]